MHDLILIRYFYLAFHGFTNKVDAPKTSVLVAGVEGLEGVAQIRLGRIAGQVWGQVGTTTLGTVPRANDSVSHHQWEVVGIGPAATLNCDRDVCEWHVIVTHTNFRSCYKYNGFSDEANITYSNFAITCKSAAGWQSDFTIQGGRQRAKMCLGYLDEIFVLNTTSSSQNHTRSTVVSLDVLYQVIARERP